jgi:hypothetical protein
VYLCLSVLEQITYTLELNISGAAGVKGRSGEYLWNVLLVEIEPAYRELDIQATPERLCFAAPGSSSSDGGNDNGGSGNSSGGGPINP